MEKTQSVLIASPEYRQFIVGLEARVLSARISAARAVNRDLILLYWDIGRGIVEKQRVFGWGDAVVEMIAADLRRTFPQVTGFSPRNVWDMRRLYATYTASEFLAQAKREIDRSDRRRILRQPVAEIPWGHNVLIRNKLTAPAAHFYYRQATAHFVWSRNVLLNQIKAGAYERAVTEKKTHNFPLALPKYLAEQAKEALKSSYNLEFLDIRREVKERELEDRLIERLRDFILELGYGFCFVGRQHRLTLGKNEYFIDLLFYHRFLKALVVFELKSDKPRFDLRAGRNTLNSNIQNKFWVREGIYHEYKERYPACGV